ncbi:MOSC domain-containing protein [Pseudonocardia sp.]|jgi:MOSC domain-containing protein YiiM|uniref:MOSC domain-containing protein n=1 Tax=Pseudonocardia sp. TaxID=60912 RepID=UPI003D11602A
MRVLTVSVGTVNTLRWNGRTMPSAIAKVPVAGPVEVGGSGLVGDRQADRKNHGGPDKAVLLYPGEHYRAWDHLPDDADRPAFGENLTLHGVLESDAVIGAVYLVGTAMLQVTQPRRPCYKLAAHHGIRDMAVRVQDTGRTGFYARVLRSGQVRGGDVVEAVSVPEHGITAADVHRVLNVERDDLPAARRLLATPGLLPESWAALLRRRLDGRLEDESRRLHGRAPRDTSGE